MFCRGPSPPAAAPPPPPLWPAGIAVVGQVYGNVAVGVASGTADIVGNYCVGVVLVAQQLKVTAAVTL